MSHGSRLQDHKEEGVKRNIKHEQHSAMYSYVFTRWKVSLHKNLTSGLSTSASKGLTHPSSIMRFCVLPSTISAMFAIAATA